MNKKVAFILYIVVLCALPYSVYATTNNALLIHASNTKLGEESMITVAVAAPDESINAVSGAISIPPGLSFVGVHTEGSIVNFWTQEPHRMGTKVQFEAIILNPGYRGTNGKLFTMRFVPQKTGSFTLNVSEGAILANDGLGTNILDTLGSATFVVRNAETAPPRTTFSTVTPSIALPLVKTILLPVITDYSPTTDAGVPVYIKGTGEPGAMTKIIFNDVSFRSLGEKFIALVQAKRKKLDEVLIKNNTTNGSFAYISPTNLVAGAYNAVPYLFDPGTNTQKESLGVQMVINESDKMNKIVVLINILALLIPIVSLVMMMYYIPWYYKKQMKLIKQKMWLEEEKIQFSAHGLIEKKSKE